MAYIKRLNAYRCERVEKNLSHGHQLTKLSSSCHPSRLMILSIKIFVFHVYWTWAILVQKGESVVKKVIFILLSCSCLSFLSTGCGYLKLRGEECGGAWPESFIWCRFLLIYPNRFLLFLEFSTYK